MGLDGGTYITRSDILRGQSWAVTNADSTRSTRGGAINASTTFKRRQLDAQAARRAVLHCCFRAQEWTSCRKETKWSCCALSSQPLQPPLVADFLGSLYNREAVLEFLLGRSGVFADTEAEHRYINLVREAAGAFDHLQSRRDVFAVHLTAMDAADAAVPGAYVCPVTDQVAGRGLPFVALPDCGHALSERALRQVRDDACPICGTCYTAADAVPLNGTPEQVAQLRKGLEARQVAQLSMKKNRKRKACAAEAGAGRKGKAALLLRAAEAETDC